MGNIVILGAGIAGISATYHAMKAGHNVICYEKNNEPGGLVANFSIDGFRFDNAIHLSFTSNDYVKELFSQTPHYSHKPNAYCIENQLWFKHPIQNNLFPLNTEDKVKLITSLVERPSEEPQNYGEWLDHQYGYEISNRYPRKYTDKYWGIAPEKLSTTWIGNRIRRSDISEVLRGAFEKRDDNHYYASEMRYPKKGGYYSFIKEIADKCNISTNKEAIKIDIKKKKVYFSDNTNCDFESIINTLPLPIIVKLIENVPEKVKQAAESLNWTTVDLISIGFNKSDIPPHLWFYIYDNGNLAARAYSPSLKSEDNVPKGKSSLQFEIYNHSSKVRFKKDDLIRNIKDSLMRDKICREEDILFIHHKHLPFGNVIFDHGMEDRRQIVLDYLNENKICTCGRFGRWDYLWSDQSFISGKEVIDNLIL